MCIILNVCKLEEAQAEVRNILEKVESLTKFLKNVKSGSIYGQGSL